MNIGLVLSGGGYRGYAHIGVIKAIQELGIKISYLSGTSAGAVTAALFASGHDWQDILSFYNNTKVFSFSNYSLLKPGLIDSSSFLKLFEEKIKFKKFNQLKIKTFISATNMVTAKGKIFHEGDIIRPVVASASLPGIFSPMLIDGDYYCDGGIVNNFPVEPLQIFCDTIIGVYVNQIEDSKAEDFDSPLSNMFRAFKIMRANDSMRKFNQCDYLIAPNEIATYSIISKANSEVIFKIGYNEAMKILKPLSKTKCLI